MTRAEYAALKAYPPEMIYGESTLEGKYDGNAAPRYYYIKGYEQAEKDTIERAVNVLVNLPSLVIPTNYIAYFREKMMEEE